MFTTWLVILASLTISGVFFWQSFGLNTLMADPGGPAVVPRVLCLVIAAAALAEAAKLVRLEDGLHSAIAAIGDFGAQMRHGVRADQAPAVRVATVMALSLIYPYGLREFGFLLASFVLIIAVAWICRLSAMLIALLAIAAPATIFVLFSTILGSRVPRGELFDIIQFF